jgi:hypothetical protein
MVKELTLNIPTSYEDITLKKWLELQREMENYKDNDEAVNALILYHLCGLPVEYVKGLDVNSYTTIISELNTFLSKTDLELQRFVTIDGIEYGFEPNLSTMTYGLFVDITKFETFTIDNNWAKIMNMLYRPVVKKQGNTYSIKPYTINDDYKKWLSVGMDIQFGCLFFFLNLLIDLSNSTLKSMTEAEQNPDFKSILQRSGNLIHQYTNLQKEISRSLTK